MLLFVVTSGSAISIPSTTQGSLPIMLQEAIMVLHNRIKEFEGLIQYIEVQASYETSDERYNLLFICILLKIFIHLSYII